LFLFGLNIKNKKLSDFIKEVFLNTNLPAKDLNLNEQRDITNMCIITDSFNDFLFNTNTIIQNRLFIIYFMTDVVKEDKNIISALELHPLNNKRIFAIQLEDALSSNLQSLSIEMFKCYLVMIWNVINITLSFEDYILKTLKDRELIEFSIKDGLTGVYNRGFFEKFIIEEIEKYNRTNNDYIFSLGIVDLDNFKRINDTYGHQVGDKVLINISKILSLEIRNYDKVFRYGGEEFILFFPHISKEKSFIIMDRLRDVISRTPIFIDDELEPLMVTISGGVSDIISCGNINKLLKTADIALYQAKFNGKNMIIKL